VIVKGGTFIHVEGDAHVCRAHHIGRYFRLIFVPFRQNTLAPPGPWKNHDTGDILVIGGTFWDVRGNVYVAEGMISQPIEVDSISLGLHSASPTILLSKCSFLIVIFYKNIYCYIYYALHAATNTENE
jgi:hypothetical protein